MTWTKISDDFADDCWTLSDAAFRLHVEGLTWTNRKLTDLRIPKSDLPRLAKHPEAVAELVAVGWWTDDGDAYLIRHHACYQRTAEDVLRQQEVNKANRAKGRARPVRERVQPDESSDGSSHRSSDEMDGPGQDRLITGTELEVGEPVTRDGPTLRVVDPPADGRCRWTSRKVAPCVVCGQGARLALDDQPTHPACRADVSIDLDLRERVDA